jgi:hypothetical protein
MTKLLYEIKLWDNESNFPTRGSYVGQDNFAHLAYVEVQFRSNSQYSICKNGVFSNVKIRNQSKN